MFGEEMRIAGYDEERWETLTAARRRQAGELCRRFPVYAAAPAAEVV